MKSIGLVILFLLSTLVQGQTVKIDSLKNLFQEDLKDSIAVSTALNLARAYIDFNVDSTKRIAQKSFSASEKIGYIPGIIQGHNLLGNCAQRKGDFEEAMLHYSEAKKIASERKDAKYLAMIQNNIGIIHTQKGEYNKALAAYFEAIDFEKEIDNQKGIAEGYNNVGVVHYHMGDMENTLAYLKKSIEISESINDLQIVKKGLMNVGAIHLYRKEYEEAIAFFKRGLEIAKKLNDQSDITIAYHNLASVYNEKGNYDKAEELYLQALDFHKKFENKRGIALEYVNLGQLAFNRNNYLKAESYFNNALAIAEKEGFLKLVEASYGGLAELKSKQGNHKEAYGTMLQFIAIKDSLLNAENSKNFAELRTKYETAEKEKALAEEQIISKTLSAEKAQLELVAANRSKWILLLLAGLVILAAFSFAILQRNKRKAQAEKDAAIINERDKGVKAVFSAQEEERKRISKELHDGIGQSLSGIKLQFQKLSSDLLKNNPEDAEKLQKLSAIVSDTADEVRSISHQMMPKALSQFGLIEALEDLLSKTFELSNMEYQFEHFGIDGRLNEDIEISLYRISQELINNIIKHSKASKVSIQIFKNQGKLILMIEDNGQGLKKGDQNGHGLLNIKSRLNTLNGDFNLEPSPGSGTIATVRLPL